MLDGVWRTLPEIASAIGAPEASVSARLRDLRKPKFGGFDVGRKARGDASEGLYEYRLRRGSPRAAPPQQPAQDAAPPKPQAVHQLQPRRWLADLMTLTDAAALAGVTIPEGVYELEAYLHERSK